jgi:23S rRNA (cytosine1962-C5)-methyltransferase
MLASLINDAMDSRAEFVDSRHATAFRLFNGFTEGLPELALDIYATALVLHDYSDPPDESVGVQVMKVVCGRWPWVTSVILKCRQTEDRDARNGQILLGTEADLPRKVAGNGVQYAINLLLNRDASFYLDTRGLRAWATANLAGKRVLNTFAYTGSLGVAAMAAPCRQVISTDLNRRFLNMAKDSFSMNGFSIRKADFIVGDFFDVTSRLRRARELFDCVILDPPFFSKTQKGTVDQKDMKPLIQKVRPLVADKGVLVVVNNALFVSGRQHMDMIEGLCADGYMQVECFIDVPSDFAAVSSRHSPKWPSDPAPFNHPTKICVLRVTRKEA